MEGTCAQDSQGTCCMEQEVSRGPGAAQQVCESSVGALLVVQDQIHCCLEASGAICQMPTASKHHWVRNVQDQIEKVLPIVR